MLNSPDPLDPGHRGEAMSQQLHIDGVPVKWNESTRGIMVWGTDVNGRECPIAEHTLKPEWVTDLKNGGSFFTGGHTYEMKTHPKFYSLD